MNREQETTSRFRFVFTPALALTKSANPTQREFAKQVLFLASSAALGWGAFVAFEAWGYPGNDAPDAQVSFRPDGEKFRKLTDDDPETKVSFRKGERLTMRFEFPEKTVVQEVRLQGRVDATYQVLVKKKGRYRNAGKARNGLVAWRAAPLKVLEVRIQTHGAGWLSEVEVR